MWVFYFYLEDGRVVYGGGVTLDHHWMLINLCIDNLILLRKGQNNTRFLCIKVDLCVLSGCRLLLLLVETDRDVHMPATRYLNYLFVTHIHLTAT